MTRRGRRGGGGVRALAVVVLLVFASFALPAGSVSTVTVDRNSSVSVATDEDGIFGLSVNDSVAIGSTDPLLHLANNADRNVTVTVSLDAGSTGAGDLVVDGVNWGESATFTLSPAADETVNIDVVQDCSMSGETITFDVDGSASSFDGFAPRSSQLERPVATRTSVVYQQRSDGTFASVNKSGVVVDSNISNAKFGPPAADFDCDGDMEAPYTEGGNITVIDRAGESQQLVTRDLMPGVRVGVGDVDGDGKPAVLYANQSDNGYLYRAEHGEPTVRVAGVSVASVTVLADFDGDGSDDIVFTDSTHNIKYYNGSVIDLGVDTDCKTCIGDPADFDGDGTLRVPYISSTGRELRLVDSNGNTASAWDGAGGPKSSMGSFDWDGDGTAEIIIVDQSDDALYYVEANGRQTHITDENGNIIKARSGDGTA